MTHNIIKTENYLLVVDDSKIKQNDWCIYRTGEVIHYLVKLNTDNLKKIIAHLPLNNSPVLEFVPLLPPLEDEVVELAQAYVINTPDNEPLRVYAFIEGYNKAKEKYKYTEEQMKRIYEKGYSAGRNELNSRESDKIKYDYIQSLQQPKMPVAFECEIFEAKDLKSVDEDWRKLGKPKTTTNSQGQAVWVGKYIY
jgi:hypothetical protein